VKFQEASHNQKTSNKTQTTLSNASKRSLSPPSRRMTIRSPEERKQRQRGQCRHKLVQPADDFAVEQYHTTTSSSAAAPTSTCAIVAVSRPNYRARISSAKPSDSNTAINSPSLQMPSTALSTPNAKNHSSSGKHKLRAPCWIYCCTLP
jgi:hypothetical protein